MRKRKKGKKLGRKKDQRKALKKSLARSLFLKERIKTTKARGTELRSFSEKIITRAKKGDVDARRRLAKLFEKKVVDKLVNEIAPRYKDRKGGYTRILKLGPRKSDGTEMVIIELV